MIIPIEWLKEYIEIEKNAEQIAESFTLLGLMLDKPIIEKNGRKILDLEHRMDRSDWLSIIGCARDLAVFENLKLKKPDVPLLKPKDIDRVDKVPITVECPDLVNRFNTRIIKNVKVSESPNWIKEKLEDYGIAPINNIVDITNYVMVEYGQPLHAQDLDRFEKREIVIRNAKKGETLQTLDETEIKLEPEMFVLTQNNEPIALGGIVGGSKTSITDKTQNIILDSGNYDHTNIRKTSRTLGIRNETVLRSEKLLHPALTEKAVQRAVGLILDLAGGEYYENEDWYPNPIKKSTQKLRFERIEKLSGEKIPLEEVKRIIRGLEYNIQHEDPDGMILEIPYFRTDVEVEDDIISDLLRLRDYQIIEAKDLTEPPPANITPQIIGFKQFLADIMVRIGAYEYITDPMVPEEISEDSQVLLQNSLSLDQAAMRTSLKKTLEPLQQEYENRGESALIFEIGRIYLMKSGQYEEREVLAALMTAKDNYEETNREIKRALSTVFRNIGISNILYKDGDKRGQAFVYQNDLLLGHTDHESFELYIDALIQAEKTEQKLVADHLNKSILDISILGDRKQPMGEVIYSIKKLDDMISKVEVKEEYSGEKIPSGKKAVLVSVEITAKDLTAEDINKVLKKITNSIEKNYNVEIRS